MQGHDFVSLYKSNNQQSDFFGEKKYSGGFQSSIKNFPTASSPLIINANRFVVSIRRPKYEFIFSLSVTPLPSHFGSLTLNLIQVILLGALNYLPFPMTISVKMLAMIILAASWSVVHYINLLKFYFTGLNMA